MRCITMKDMRKRIRGLQISMNESVDSSSTSLYINAAHRIARSGRPSDIINAIENGLNNSHINAPFSVYMELFDALTEKGTASQISKIGSFLEENIVQRPRDAKQTQITLKRRLSRIQNKSKISIMDDIQDAIQNSLPQSVSPTVENVVVNAYESLLERAEVYSNCDRVIENYNRISKRFNIDKLICENTPINGVKDTVAELCEQIDTYTLPTDVKFNTVIETAWYGFESNCISYSKADILESAIDFFLFKEDGAESVKRILDTTIFYDKDDDMDGMDIFMEDEPEEDSSNPDPTNISDETKLAIEAYLGMENKPVKVVSENSNFNDMFKKFKKEELSKEDPHPESKLRSLVSRLYSKNVDDVIEGTPDLLSWIRTFLIVGSGAVPIIGPVLMIVGFIADRFIALDYSQKESEKMYKCFSNEIKKTQKKIESTEDKDDKEKLEKYLKSLKDARSKIDDYCNSLLTDDEISKRYEDMDIDDMDLDDDFFAESFIRLADYVRDATDEKVLRLSPLDIEWMVADLPSDALTDIAYIASKYPDDFHKDHLIKGIENNIEDVRTSKIKFDSIIDKTNRLTELNSAKDKLMNDTIPKSNSLTISEAADEMEAFCEAYTAVNMIVNLPKEQTQLLEASISNKLKLASMKLRNAFTKLSDKDRQISKSVDVGLNNMKKGVERALTNDNRESIIKGSILPSASKIIKLAILNAGLVAIGQPVIAVISTLGYLACSAKFKTKERQMVTDEIEIELKMCQKYIDIAESKNDMQALKQLLMIQRDLERQHQRIKYKMKIEMGQKYYDAKSVGD